MILMGAFFLGTGITGLIISETCCFPPNCLEENICDFSQDKVPKNSPNFEFLEMGAFLVVAGAIIYLETYNLHHK